MIFNSRDLFYKQPFGAVAAGTPVTLRLLLADGLDTPVLEMYEADDFVTPLCYQPLEPAGTKDGSAIWQTVFTPPRPGLYFYRFTLCGGSRRLGMDEGSCGVLDDNDLWQLTVYSVDYETPRQLWGGVFYQIFPDRFCFSGQWKPNLPTGRLLHGNWNEPMISRPDVDNKFLCNDYFGGDLAGITGKLPYLATLGVTGIYLNPIFEAHSNHRYNTADYRKIDPLLGTEDDFITLCDAAHRLGMVIILDGVFNHTGSDSIYFNKEKRYGDHVGAYNDAYSPYREWFSWIEYPRSYRSWWGFETLPDLNEGMQSYRDFICGPDGVLRSWLRAGADGFRLDVADELPDEFIVDIRTAIKTEKPNALLLGEVWEDASNKQAYGIRRRYLQGQELDSVMNYPWRSAILSFLRYGGGEWLLDAISIILENYPPQSVNVMLNSLSTHDVPRAITAIAALPMEGHDRDWQRANNELTPEAYYSGRQLFLLGALLQYTLPGCPCLYYGDEAGLTGYADPFNRGTYPWGQEDAGLVRFFQLLGGLRSGLPVLRLGSFSPVHFDQNSCAFLREYEGERILVVVNRSNNNCKIPFPEQELATADVLLTAGGMLGSDTLYGDSGAIIRLN
ncbi:MAG: glycoside hydrolase family 13 protein, partial [Angelakisella sp.]